MRASRRVVPIILAFGALTVAGCGDDGDTATGASTTVAEDAGDGTTTTAAAGAGTTSATTDGDAGTTATTTSDSGGDDLALEDGEHVAYLSEIDVAGRTLTFDVIQFLSGQEAADAYHEAYPDDPEGPPNDYFIVNANDRLRTFPVADPVDVQVVNLAVDSDADLDPITWEELATYLAEQPVGDAGELLLPFTLTVADGTVVAIAEQYIP